MIYRLGAFDAMKSLPCLVLTSLAISHTHALSQPISLRPVLRGMPFVNSTTPNNLVVSTSNSPDPFISPDPSLPSTSTSDPRAFRPYFPNATTTTPITDATCVGFITYTGSVPPTIFFTVTEGFDVTVTASNVSVTVPETLITPLPPCASTIMPALAQPVTPNFASFSKSTDGGHPPDSHQKTQTQPAVATDQPFVPPASPATSAVATPEDAGFTVSMVYSSVPYTSTVTITKKTPITVVQSPTSSPGVNFDNPPGGGGSGGDNQPPTGTRPTGGNGPPEPSNPPHTTTRTSVLGLGEIIASIIFNGGPTSTVTTGGRSTAVNGIPVVVFPSTVVIGAQTVSIPSSPTSLHVDGVGFEVGPSAIIAPSTTITIAPVHQDQVLTITPRPQTTTVTTGDELTFIVGHTVAVIAGTTYRIGQGAPATTITVGGATISVGPAGVGLPQTTVNPVAAGPSGYLILTADGLTLSVDENEAILSSMTYRIGSGAPQTTAVINGETISFGPSGVGLPSTTIAPTTVPSRTASTGSRSTAASSSSATGATSNENSGVSMIKRIPFSEILGWHLMTALGFYHLMH